MQPVRPLGVRRELSTPEEVEEHARQVVEEFSAVMPGGRLASAPTCVVCEELGRGTEGDAWDRSRVRFEVGRAGLFLHMDARALAGISDLALQGWIEFEMVLSANDRDRPSWFNFKKQILPLLPTSGSAVYLMRELVEYLATAVRNHQVTRELAELGRGVPQVHFRRLAVSTLPDRYREYAAAVFHDWIRALNLSKRARQYVVWEPLARKGLEHARELQAEWREGSRLLAEDQRLLDDLSAILGAEAGGDPGRRLVAMFLRVRDALLLRRVASEVSGDVH